MQGYELVKGIEQERRTHPDRIFIKWWRVEEDYIDFDLVARFLENLDYSVEIAGFELIDQDQMLGTVESLCKGRLTKMQRNGGWVLHWTPPKGAELEEALPEYPYTPETLLKILDAETNGNFID